jgi:hypothetical protein
MRNTLPSVVFDLWSEDNGNQLLTDRISKDFLLTYYRDALNMNPVQLYPFMVVSPKTEITQMTIRLFLKNKNLNNSLDLSFKHLFHITQVLFTLL